uniref:ASXL transcriptional regulator 3 n=1 Tax=Erpetoichthys calabaricus TaxID=27687 RepID=A0A8C4RW23_ERPCA
MKDKRKKKDRTWAEAARLALEKHANTPMTAKQILEVIQKEGLKETSGTSPLACLNAMLHTNTRVGDGTFFKIPGKSGLYALKKEESPSLADGASEPVCESDLEGTEMTETNNSTGEENGVCPMKLPEEQSSENETNPTTAAVQNKSVSSTQQHTKKALKQALRQQHKRRNGVSMMVNKSVPRVVLTPLKVSDEQPESPTGSESKNGFGDGDGCEKDLKHGQRSPTGKQISQHLKKLKKSGLGHLKWTKAEDIDIETPGSILVNTNLRALINKHTFASLPQHFQQYLLLLLPEVDRQMGSDGVLRLSNSALNNEFFAYAAQGWKQRLAEGEFTPEMQIRIRQEMEKEKKIELWKEKFYETYYGEKSGITHEECMILTSVQESDKERSSSVDSSPDLPGPSCQTIAEKKEVEIPGNMLVCEESEDQSLCTMEPASKLATEQPTEDMTEQPADNILFSEISEIAAEESLVQEEIAEEIDTNTCEYIEDNVKPELDVSENVDNTTHKSKENSEVLGFDNANVNKICVSESFVETVEEGNDTPIENEVDTSDNTVELDSTTMDQELSPTIDIEKDSIEALSSVSEESSPTEEPKDQELQDKFQDSHSIETEYLDEHKDQSEKNDELLVLEKEDISTEHNDIPQPISEEQSLSKEMLSSDQSQLKTEAVTISEESMPCSEEPAIPTSCIALTADDEQPAENSEPSQVQSETEDDTISSKSQTSPLQEPQLEGNSSFESLEVKSPKSQLQASPALSCISETLSEDKNFTSETLHVSVSVGSMTAPEEPETKKHEALQTPSASPDKDQASPSNKSPSVYDFYCDREIDTIETKQQLTNEKHDSQALTFTNTTQSCSPEPESERPLQLSPEMTSVVSVESVPVPDIPKEDDLPLQITVQEPKQENKDAIQAEKRLPDIPSNDKGLKQTKHYSAADRASSALSENSWSEMPKIKHHKPHQPNHQHRYEEPYPVKHSEHNKSPELLKTDSREPEISKRKTGEQHSGICKEKRARIEEIELSSSLPSSTASGKETPPKEELRVPPLKIQLSKVGLPFIIKTNPVSKPEPKVSSTVVSSAGRNTGARTLADIKARAQQARAQREAAAAAAVAAAARITSGESGVSSEGSKTRTLAHIKEQTKAKLFAKHQARAHSHQTAKGSKVHSSKEDRCPTDSQPLVHSKTEGPTGVIIVNPNRRSPDKGLAVSVGTSESRITVKSTANMPTSSSTSHNTAAQQCSSNLIVSTDVSAVPASMNSRINSNMPSHDESALSHNYSVPASSSSVLMTVSSPSLQTSIFKVAFSKPSAKTNVTGSPCQAIVPKYAESTSKISTEVPSMPCSLNSATPTCPVSYAGLRYTSSTAPHVSCVNTLQPQREPISFQNSLECSQRNCPPRCSTPFSVERKSVPFTSDYHTSNTNERRDLQNYGDKISIVNTVKVLDHISTNVSKNATIIPTENSVSEMETAAKLRQIPQADSSVSNKAIPCKVIVDHTSGLYSSAPTSALTDARQNLANKGVKTETVLRLQESIMSRSEPSRLKSEQSTIFSTSSRMNNKKLHMAYSVMQAMPAHQQDRQREGNLSEQNTGNLIYSSLLYKHAEKAVTNEHNSDPKCWLREKEKPVMDTMLLHKNKYTSDTKEKKGDIVVMSERMMPTTDCSNFLEPRVIKSEPSDMDTEEFKEPVNPHHTTHLFDGRTVKTSPSSAALTEDCMSVSTDNQRRLPAPRGSGCRLSSVEANNPLVTQLLQGNLPLEKVLPQPRSGARLEINRLPVPMQNSLVRSPSAAERNVIDNTQVCASPESSGHISGLSGPVHIRKPELQLNKRMAKSAVEFIHIKCEQGPQMLEAENKSSSCLLGSHLSQIGPRQPFVQEWVNKSPMHGRITPSPEIKQQTQALPACSFQKGLLGSEKNGSFPSDASTTQRLFNSLPSDVRDPSHPTTLLQANIKATSDSGTPTPLVFCNNREQKGPEVSVPHVTEHVRKRTVFSTPLPIKPPDDIGSAVQAAQTKSLLHPPNGEVSTDQKQMAIPVEINKRLGSHPSVSICRNIKVEPISYEEGLTNNCEMAMKQSAYEQNEAKEHVPAFHLKTSEFPPYMAPETQKAFSQLNSQKIQPAPQPPQMYGNYSAIHFSNANFNRTASVIEKSFGNFLGNSGNAGSGLVNQGSSASSQKFADSNNAEELELKCSCRLKAMIVCKGCGAFCHDDCIGPSKLCVACLVVR